MDTSCFSFGNRVVLTRVYCEGRVVNSGLRKTTVKKPVTHIHFTNEETTPHRDLISVVNPATSEQTVREDAIFIAFRHSWCKVLVESSYELVQCRRSQLKMFDPSNAEHKKLLAFPRPVKQPEVDASLKRIQRWVGTAGVGRWVDDRPLC